ncbi:MAG: M20 family metallopeptidase [Clostridia bacterium]
MNALLSDLLNIDTQNPPGHERALCAYIEAYLKDAGCPVVVQELGSGRANIVSRIPGVRHEGALCLNGHLDTVPHGDEGWLTKPGVAVCRDGRLYARGASDMKSGLAALLYAFAAFARKGVRPDRDILFTGTADEESGGMGARALCESGLIDDVSEILIGEPTGCALGLAAKGALWLKVCVTGRASHGAYPERGVNAIDAAYRFADGVRALLSGHTHALLSPATATVTGISGGIRPNMVPDRAELVMDVRTTPDMDHGALLKSLQTLIEGMRRESENLNLTLEVLNNRMPVETRADCRLARNMDQCWQAVSGVPARETGLGFFSDGSIFLRHRPYDILLFGPGDSDQAHTPNESVALDAYHRATQAFERLLAREAHASA